VILFKKLRWKNLLSTGNIFTELNLNEHNNVLIVGENGAGKSTFLDALSFVLFNKPFRNINKPQLVNTITQKGLLVEIEYSIGKNEYKIIRGIKPAVFEVYCNDKLLNQSAEVKDYQEILEKQILKINHKSFCQVVVLGSASYTPFMQLPAGQRREIIEDLLDLQIFTTMNSVLKTKIATNDIAIKDSQSKKILIEEKIKLIKEHLVDLQRNNAKLIDDKKERIAETENNIEEHNKKLTSIRRVINNLKDKTEDFESLQKRVNKLSKLKHQIEAKLKIINDDVAFFESHDNCPTCKQEIDKQFKCDTINNKNVEIEDIKNGLEKLVSEYESTNAKINEIMEINSKINDLKLEEHRYRTQVDSYEQYKTQLTEEINSINNEPVSQENTTKIDDLEIDLKDNEKEYNNLYEERQLFQAAASLLKDGGIKAKIIKQYVPIINKLINKYLSSMDFFVQFELDETFKETIKSRYRDEFSYASFSEGEKFRINLAVLFTWRAIAKLRNSINTNILIMDEVMDSSLDYNGTEEFLKIIKNITNDTNVFIISHKTDTIADKFEKVIKFAKHKNFSRIVT
jgi:DNA repair exonuclease SbcCD ATPase subunit